MHPAVSNGSYDVAKIRADFPALALQVYGKPLVYLDNAASAQKPKAVLDRMYKAATEQYAQKTDGKMMTRALLLSDEAEADNKPELEIFADDVVCGHGATAGALDPGLKFYLMSRGIPAKEAEALLIQAFIDETIEEIAHEGIRRALMFAALKWLGSRS